MKNKGEKMRIAFYTLGCKVNQYETEILMNAFSKQGFDIVDYNDDADIYVVNSCTVTSSGDSKTKKALRKFKRQNPTAKIVLTGCFPQAFPDIAQKIPEADVITGSYNRGGLIKAVLKSLATGEKVIDITPHSKKETFEDMQTNSFKGHTRAFIKIQDGCNRYCSYCIIPTARGPIRSKPIDKLNQELLDLSNNGYLEVVLVGINLSFYGKDIGLNLIDAITLACSIDKIKRVRLGSLEPELISDEDIDTLSKLDKFCPQFHLSLQSGCTETLKRMNRHYTAEKYYKIVKKLREKFDNPSFTTDIMVGFPSETDEEFQQSLKFAEKIGFSKAHVFAYSIREGTKAAKMENQIVKKVKDKRSKLMIEITNKTKKEFLESQIGQVCEVLFETNINEYGYEGYTKNYTPVFVKSQENISGKILKIKIIKTLNDFCVGEISNIQ